MREDDCRKAAYYNECVASALRAIIAVPALLTANCVLAKASPPAARNRDNCCGLKPRGRALREVIRSRGW